MAKPLKKEGEKTPQQASNVFHSIMKASVTVKQKEKKVVKKLDNKQ